MPPSPDLWNELLGVLPPGSVVAGGAVRDYLLGVEPKDIDIFVFNPDPPADAPIEGFKGKGRDDSEEYQNMNGVQFVFAGQYKGVDVDVVYVSHSSAEKLVSSFDFGITRCWWDGELHVTTEWYADNHSKVVTLLVDPYERYSRMLARFERFNARHGGNWRLRK